MNNSEQGLKRRIMLTVNQFTLVPELIAKSDLITAIPERILKRVPIQSSCILSNYR